MQKTRGFVVEKKNIRKEQFKIICRTRRLINEVIISSVLTPNGKNKHL